MTADATIYVGGLDEKVTEALLWELFLQAGPVGELHKLFTRCRTHYCGLAKEQPPPAFGAIFCRSLLKCPPCSELGRLVALLYIVDFNRVTDVRTLSCCKHDKHVHAGALLLCKVSHCVRCT